jgi:hypothetical protein
VAEAQPEGRGPRRAEARAARSELPAWSLDPAFAADAFTFARIRYTSRTGRRSQTWDTDYPDSDLNFSFRLHQLTSLRVVPRGVVVELTDPRLFDYPWIFMSGVGGLTLNEPEVTALRRYLQAGGFLLADDFWGEAEWAVFAGELARVLPGRAVVDLPLSHPIFHAVYDLNEKRQIPNVFHATRYRGTGITWERPDAREPHYRAILDARGRLMVMICHNTDLGDGWEEEATDPWYFTEFSEKTAYPLGINILFYAMTH